MKEIDEETRQKLEKLRKELTPEETKQKFEKLLKEFTPDDLVRLILLEAGYEDSPIPFSEKEMQRLLFRNYDRLPTLKNGHVYFRTNGTFPYSPYVERIFQSMSMSGVFRRSETYALAKGTREYVEKHERTTPDSIELEVIKELGAEFRRKMLGEKDE